MDKSKILNSYIKELYDKIEGLRNQYPKARSNEIIEMEKGFRYAITESSKWIERTLEVIESTIPTNKEVYIGGDIIIPSNQVNISDKKKKSFLQVVSEGFKDMGKDVFNANQTTMKKDKEKK